MLDLLDDFNVKFGFEFPASTLEIINNIDTDFIDSLKRKWKKGKCEVIGSGYSQSIFPLIPAKVNYMNLVLGNRSYQKLLGSVPKTAYVNEQAFSSGIVELYVQAGFENIIMDWDNARKFKNFPNEYVYAPKSLVGADGSKINLIWNSTISFQKFQRYSQGTLTLENYLKYLFTHLSNEEDHSFLLYAYDLEIFDYMPGHGDLHEHKDESTDFERIRGLFEFFEEDERVEIITPGEIVEKFPPTNQIQLGTAEYPIPCKKQYKYNVTRWAVCGRENSRINGQCYEIFQKLQNIIFLNELVSSSIRKVEIDKIWLNLINLWSSDFRTHTTDKKYTKFRNHIGYTLEFCDNALQQLKNSINVEDDFVLINPHGFTWKYPFEFKYQFKHGEVRENISIILDGKEAVTQLEEQEFYHDGSLRSVKIIIEPIIKAKSSVQGKIISKTNENELIIHSKNKNDILETPEVALTLLPDKGGSIGKLKFPNIAEEFFIGELEHGFYNDIMYSPDWYSGHTVIYERSTKKHTDLETTKLNSFSLDNTPIRIPVTCKINIPIGIIQKTYYVYVNQPRIDLNYHFSLNDIFPLYFRAGIATFNPNCFDKEKLKYTTNNGGYEYETYDLKGRLVKHDEPVSLNVSSHQCLGATEGWVGISDDEKGFAILNNKAKQYSVPLLHYEELKDSYFLRLYTSISEMDDTTETFLKGHNNLSLTFLGHKNDINEVIKTSKSINNGLIICFKE